MRLARPAAASFLLLCLWSAAASAREAGLPQGFVHLKSVAPDIIQDIRYHGWHNFLGRPVAGYEAGECILSIDAAKALKGVNDELTRSGYALKVYDCYRPDRAVQDFVKWSADQSEQAKAEFYPNVDKKDFFELGYVAKRSGHSRGSTVDVTIVCWPFRQGESYTPGQELRPCTAGYDTRFNDGSIDMGTGYDCMDVLSHPSSTGVPMTAQQNRAFLAKIMDTYGFSPYDKEWWHFTLKKEPFPNTYFDFPVTAPAN